MSEVDSSLRARREALGWSRKDLASRAGVDPSVIQMLEFGHLTDEASLQRCTQALAQGEAAGG